MVALVLSLFPTAFAGGKHETEFTGTVQSLPSNGFIGDWTIGGRTVHVTTSTRVNEEDGHITVGAVVKVEGRNRADNSVDATNVELRQAGSGGGNGGGDDNGGNGEAKFKGTIESFPAGFVGDWQIGGRTIHVTASTRIETNDGPVAVGAFVEVEGTMRADGSMDATKIEVKSNPAGGDGRDELKGTVESLPNTQGFVGDWRVAGRTIHVSAATVIDTEHGAVAVGAFVEIHGTQQTDGSINATRIEVNPSSGGGSGGSNEGQATGFKGTIQSLPGTANLIGDWTISGRTVHVVSSTRLNREHGPFAVGVRVKVKGLLMSDGTIVATKIQVRDSQ
jgi:DNA-binding transcriptional regulator of glucitol operon